MHRLTLILSDLYLRDEEASAIAASADAMPNLEWLLRFARTRTRVEDWRQWLGAELGYARSDIRPFAPFAARGLVGAAADAWLATPVHLAARLDHVRLDARGVLRLGAEERTAWCDAFARTFGPQYALHDDGVGGFFLSGFGAAAADAVTDDPARLLGADVGAHLPRGPGAGELRRLAAEIEMWLHDSPLHAARARKGLPRATALWLWGGGAMRTVATACAVPDMVHFYGADPFLAALARDRDTAARDFPAMASEIDELEPAAQRVVALLAPMSGLPHDRLAALDEDWLRYARGSIAAGALTELDVVAHDTHWHLAARPLVGFRDWWFWRPRRGWLEQLVHASHDTKA
jgi:hypothetical protein